MRVISIFCGVLGAAMFLDVVYCDGRYAQAVVRMFTEMALGMKLIG
jgi:hypothetical protein